jgi:predicted DNA binding protein
VIRESVVPRRGRGPGGCPGIAAVPRPQRQETRLDDDAREEDVDDAQREALAAAAALGYYDQPRGATSEDVADELDCATATAAEHLRKAEATLVDAALTGLDDGNRR